MSGVAVLRGQCKCRAAFLKENIASTSGNRYHDNQRDEKEETFPQNEQRAEIYYKSRNSELIWGLGFWL